MPNKSITTLRIVLPIAFNCEKEILKMNSIEPTLCFILGPPIDGGWKKELFDKYQQGRNTDNAEVGKLWEEYERETIGLLFARENREPSPLEEVFSLILQAPIRIAEFELSWALDRGLWLTAIKIPLSAVFVAEGCAVGFPPDPQARGAIAEFIGEVLRRDWIHAVSIGPVNSNRRRTRSAVKRTAAESAISAGERDHAQTVIRKRGKKL